jgi:hypothetical protein
VVIDVWPHDLCDGQATCCGCVGARAGSGRVESTQRNEKYCTTPWSTSIKPNLNRTFFGPQPTPRQRAPIESESTLHAVAHFRDVDALLYEHVSNVSGMRCLTFL